MSPKRFPHEIKWQTEKDNRDSHYWCHGCGELLKEAFIIYKVRGDLILCLKCMQSLQSAISPLSILVQTGKNTKEERE